MGSSQPLGSVLVVGGCGFLGHHIVSQLLEPGNASQVSVLDLHTARNRFPSVSYHDVDISSKTEVLSILQQTQPRVVIHTASPFSGSDDLALFEKVNVGGTLNLLECAQDTNCVKAFVYTSSASVVHDNVSDLIYGNESLPVLHIPQQTEAYSHTKAVAEELVLAANRARKGFLTAALRPACIFGEGDYGITGNMITAAQTGKYKLQMGDGQNVYDFTYVGNVAHAHILAALALLKTEQTSSALPTLDTRVDGEAFFVTNDDPYPFWDFARALGAAAGYPVRKEEIWVIPQKVGLMIGLISEWMVRIISLGKRKPLLNWNTIMKACINRTFRIDKAKERLGYAPTIGMQEGIRLGADWFRSVTKKAQ